MSKSTILVLALTVLLTSLSALRNISESYYAEASGDYQLAYIIMQEVSSQDMDDPFYQIRIAWLLYKLERYPEALVTYQKANRTHECLDSITGIINCHLALGNWQEAMQLADMQIKLHPDNSTLIGKAAYAAYMLKNYAKASEYYSAILRVYPWDMENRGYLVNNLYLSGDVSGARKHYQLLKKYYPQSSIISIYRDHLE